MFDVLILNGTVIDGTANATAKQLDVGIANGFIKAVDSRLSHCQSREVIDADGHTVVPGFIDVHAHSELSLLSNPYHKEKVSQGVTTEITGQCGQSCFPLSPEDLKRYTRYTAGTHGTLPAQYGGSYHEFRDLLDGKVAINTAHLVAHGPLRLHAKDMRSGAMSQAQLDVTKGLLAELMQEGAVGFSTGLSYFPQAWADVDELVELCKVVKRYDGVFTIHLRSVFSGKRFDPVQEALEIARRSGVKLHFGHYRTGPDQAGEVEDLLKPLEEGIKQGLDVTLDLYPYPQGASRLLMFVPSWANEGAPEELMERLSDRECRVAIRDQIELPGRVRDWDEIIINHLITERNEWMIGKDLSMISRRLDRTPEDVIVDLLLQEDLAIGFLISPPRDDVIVDQMARDQMDILARPYAMIGSDSIHMSKKPHPRAYGAFPRFLGRYRRRFGTLPLETMINRATQVPARRFNLVGRGTLSPGSSGDVVVLDAENLWDKATYSCPSQYSEGILHVIINGEKVFESGDMTGSTPGRCL